MYTKKQFGKELKQVLVKREKVSFIGQWAYSKYMQHILDIDPKLRKFLLDLNTMEMSPEFEYSYEELDEIVDRLIAGDDITL
ncbi:MAG: hypothetical protein CL947_01425 [Epsilonproteobacteria bacterium]|nr:hypothetical protein [Campylobacterota bacterium]|tara:strand:+ start:1943 stop:2188 length:246 start_codon:yes stop_codon:yes gene_type:complete